MERCAGVPARARRAWHRKQSQLTFLRLKINLFCVLIAKQLSTVNSAPMALAGKLAVVTGASGACVSWS